MHESGGGMAWRLCRDLITAGLHVKYSCLTTVLTTKIPTFPSFVPFLHPPKMLLPFLSLMRCMVLQLFSI